MCHVTVKGLLKKSVFLDYTTTCILLSDVNECVSQQRPCDQNCDNSPGSYQCSCNRGYTL